MEDNKDKILNEITKRLNQAPFAEEHTSAQGLFAIGTTTRAFVLGAIISAFACYAIINSLDIKKRGENQIISTNQHADEGVDIYDATHNLPVTVYDVVPLPPRYNEVNGI